MRSNIYFQKLIHNSVQNRTKVGWRQTNHPVSARICIHLQILQNALSLITKYVGWFSYKMLHTLLHNAHIITKCRTLYYKMRNLLQNASLVLNAAEQGHYKFTDFFRVKAKKAKKLFHIYQAYSVMMAGY